MNKEIEKIQQEKQSLTQFVNKLDEDKNKALLRIAEIQGVIKYINKKEDKKNGKH